QKLQQFEARANFGTWVYRIAANYAIDRLRQRQKEEARREQPDKESSDAPEQDPLMRVRDEKPTPERLMQSTQLRREMQRAISKLSDAERTAFGRRRWEGRGIEKSA